jgi:hypothetical protein
MRAAGPGLLDGSANGADPVENSDEKIFVPR